MLFGLLTTICIFVFDLLSYEEVCAGVGWGCAVLGVILVEGVYNGGIWEGGGGHQNEWNFD